jgi:hypothetical protein
MKRRVKEWLKDGILFLHKFLLRFKISVIPVHYYSPVPDINELSKTRSIWARESYLHGVQFDPDEQCRNLIEICQPFEPEFRGNQTYLTAAAAGWGPGFGYIEAQALHGFIRHFKPRRIVEVGAGVTTHCMLAALRLNEQEDSVIGTITSIEPYPSDRLQQAPVKLIAQPVQTVEYDVFQSLERGDLLFIDSSHAVKTGSDVIFLLLEVLPRLKPGVLVHFHDIFLPYDYRPDILYSFFDWQETAMLHAFLIHNQKMEVLFCMTYLHFKRPQTLQQVFPEYRPFELPGGLVPNRATSKLHLEDDQGHFPASIFLRIKEPK